MMFNRALIRLVRNGGGDSLSIENRRQLENTRRKLQELEQFSNGKAARPVGERARS